MTDIVERLREPSDPCGECRDCYEMERQEAANEIERLRAMLDHKIIDKLVEDTHGKNP